MSLDKQILHIILNHLSSSNHEWPEKRIGLVARKRPLLGKHRKTFYLFKGTVSRVITDGKMYLLHSFYIFDSLVILLLFSLFLAGSIVLPHFFFSFLFPIYFDLFCSFHPVFHLQFKVENDVFGSQLLWAHT